MKAPKRLRLAPRVEWTKITVPRGETVIKTQFAIEQKVEFVVRQLHNVFANARVEYIRDHVNVFGSNGQKVKIAVR